MVPQIELATPLHSARQAGDARQINTGDPLLRPFEPHSAQQLQPVRLCSIGPFIDAVHISVCRMASACDCHRNPVTGML